ncbi:glutamine amidotransferase-related protein [Aliamphritea ceti]|uniref:glutamine amidotransferase-related protein n=1 Tax=Aliamphritea ceti TaxID=1524258 RepID=UPI0021C2A688|nr:gamma-glutamyl-gamma-aminobutyrate hydrolase family protein [Aliamphritea ceti]
MKVGILAAGITPEELQAQFGSYADMFVQLFNTAEYEFEYDIYDVREDIFPTGAEVCDSWIITGSKSGVYENQAWMQRLKTLIMEIHQQQKPLLGICFGHQIIAEAFGGKVIKYNGEWGLGLQTYQLISDSPHIPGDVSGKPFTINAVHQDQVVEKPAAAEVFASSDFCNYAGLVYGDRIMTFQGHPEFTVEFEDALLTFRDGDGIPHEHAQQGLRSLAEPDAKADSLQVAHWMANVLLQRPAS